jgi:protein-S-isoprenylcysteine O-methyltransferase Ste14
MVARACFALLLVGFPLVVAMKIAAQRRALGRSPVVLGKAPGTWWDRWFERLGPAGLLVWPVVWLWAALGAAPLRTGAAGAVGTAAMALGGLVAAVSIFAMGRAWRIGIDPENRSELAEGGPYRWIRHPIYSGMLVMLIGTAILVSHPAIAAGALLTGLGITHQARREEQYLLGAFGDRYAGYLARTGRFFPRLRKP